MKSILRLTLVVTLILYASDLLHAQAARIDNIQFYLDMQGSRVNITYDLIDYSDFETYEVKLTFRDGNNQVIVPASVSGDIGKGVRGGLNKKISWSIFEDADELSETARPEITIISVETIPIDPTTALIMSKIDKSGKNRYNFKFKRDGLMVLGIGTGITAVAFKLKGDHFIDQQKLSGNIDEYKIAGDNANRCYTWSKVSGGISVVCVGYAIYQYIHKDYGEKKKNALFVMPGQQNGVSLAWVYHF